MSVKIVKDKLSGGMATAFSSLMKDQSTNKPHLVDKLCNTYKVINQIVIAIKVMIKKFNYQNKFSLRSALSSVGVSMGAYTLPTKQKLNQMNIKQLNVLQGQIRDSLFSKAVIQFVTRRINQCISIRGFQITGKWSIDDASPLFKPLDPFISINFKYSLHDFQSVMNIYQVLQQSCQEYYQYITSPNRDTKQFSAFLKKYVTVLRRDSRTSKCPNAIDLIQNNCANLSDRYPQYYKRAVTENNMGGIMSYFIEDIRQTSSQGINPRVNRQLIILSNIITSKYHEAKAAGKIPSTSYSKSIEQAIDMITQLIPDIKSDDLD